MPADSIRPLHPSPRSLSEFCATFGLEADLDIDHIELTGVSTSTRNLDAGDLFVALPGRRAHGANFAAEVAEAGAVAILTDAVGAEIASGVGLPILVTENPRAALGEVSAWVYRTDPEHPKLFAVTGTNGKTSTAYILDGILTQLGFTTGLSTTVERGVGEERIESSLTTPEANELHALIARMREVGAHAASIEVSAQAVTRNRVDGLFFDVVSFLNLSHDHLDDYESFEDYLTAKLNLFTPERSRRGVVCLDSEWGASVVEESRIPVTTIAVRSEAPADWRVRIEASSGTSTSFTLEGPDGRSISTTVPLPGWFSAANASTAIVMLVESGIDLDEIAHVLKRDGGIKAYVPGRTELISGPDGPRFYLDYGHTPDAFEQTLHALREFTTGRLFMIFGADGDRDVSKRPDMGRIAATLADVVIITDYNPRTEDPASIRRTLLDAAQAAAPGGEIYEIPDARLGIRKAVSLAGPGDTILIAGPGHETANEVNGEMIDYSAREEARTALREAGWKTHD